MLYNSTICQWHKRLYFLMHLMNRGFNISFIYNFKDDSLHLKANANFFKMHKKT
jgi:hypothetical protein